MYTALVLERLLGIVDEWSAMAAAQSAERKSANDSKTANTGNH